MATLTPRDGPGTGSDLGQDAAGEPAPRKASRPIFRHQIEEGLDALGRPFARAFGGQGVGPGEVGRFLPWATLGNIVGGVVFVAILKYGLARPEAHAGPAPAL